MEEPGSGFVGVGSAAAVCPVSFSFIEYQLALRLALSTRRLRRSTHSLLVSSRPSAIGQLGAVSIKCSGTKLRHRHQYQTDQRAIVPRHPSAAFRSTHSGSTQGASGTGEKGPAHFVFTWQGAHSHQLCDQGAHELRKELVGLEQGLGEGVDLGPGVVHGERGAAGGGDAEALHQGLGAVVAGAGTAAPGAVR